MSCPGSSVSLVFSQGLDKHKNGEIVDLLMILDNGVEYLGNGGIVPKVFSDSLPSNIVAVKVAYRETISFSVPNSCSC